jgi:DNA-binding transcriptional LysR family regulator
MTAMQRWHLTENGKPISVAIGACLSSNNGDALRDAALKGIGIALLPTFIAGKDIAEKRLQIVLPENQPDDLTIHALYAPNRYLAAKTRVFIDFLVDRFGNTPSWDVCFDKR